VAPRNGGGGITSIEGNSVKQLSQEKGRGWIPEKQTSAMGRIRRGGADWIELCLEHKKKGPSINRDKRAKRLDQSAAPSGRLAKAGKGSV